MVASLYSKYYIVLFVQWVIFKEEILCRLIPCDNRKMYNELQNYLDSNKYLDKEFTILKLTINTCVCFV